MIHSFFGKIGATLSALTIALLAHLGFTPSQSNLGSTVPITPATFQTSLSAPLATTDTSMTLANGTLLDGSNLSGYTCFTVDSGQANLEYICGTAAGTSVTGLVRGINPLNGTSTVSSLIYAHRRGADVKISDFPAISVIGRIANGQDYFPGVVKYDGSVSVASVMADNRNLVNYGTLTSVTLAGSPPATPTVQGHSRISVVAASTTDPVTVGDNDPRVPTLAQAQALPGTSGTGASSTNKYVDNNDTATSSTANKVVRALSTGLIDTSFIPPSTKFGGTGAYGAFVATSTVFDLGGANVFVKNFTSFSVTGTNSIRFINPNANGTNIIFKVSGNATITSASTTAIDLRGLGGAGGSTNGVSGNAGYGLITYTNPGLYQTSAFSTPLGLYVGQNGIYGKVAHVFPGAGGAGGSVSVATGGNGGAGFYMEIGGSLNGTSTILATGNAGVGTATAPGGNITTYSGGGGASNSNGTAGQTTFANVYGCGGGGGGGNVLIVAGSIVTNTMTITTTGGAGGTGAACLNGGAGGNGYSLVTTRTEY